MNRLKSLKGAFLMYLACFAAMTVASFLLGLVIKLALYLQGWEVRLGAAANAGLAVMMVIILVTAVGVAIGNRLEQRRQRLESDCGMTS